MSNQNKSSVLRSVLENQRQFIYHLLGTTLLFAVYCLWFRSPILANGHLYLWLSKQDEFTFWNMGNTIAKSPLFALLYYWLLRLDCLQSGFYFFLIINFVIHSAAVFLVIEKILGLFKETGINRINYVPYISIATVLFAFHPNFLELVLLPGATTLTLGGLFLYLTFYSKTSFFRFIFSLCAFAIYETYIFPVFAFLFIAAYQNYKQSVDFKKVIYHFLPAVLAIIVFSGIRLGLGYKTGDFQQTINLDFAHNAMRIIYYFFGVIVVNYEHEISTVTELTVSLVLLTLVLLKGGIKYFLNFVLILLAGLFSCSLDLVVPYEGTRIIYGAYFFKIAALVFLFALVLRFYHPSVFFVLVAILLPVYLKNLVSIYEVRQANFQNQQNIQRLIKGVYKNSEPAQTLLMPSNFVHFNSADWPLEANSTIQFKLFRHLFGLQKDFQIRILGYDNMRFSTSDLPLLYPARSFVYQQKAGWETDENSYTGQVFHIEKGSSGNVVWGPYIQLDSGRYRVEIAYRQDNSPVMFPEFGGLDVKVEKGTVKLAGIPFYYSPGKGDNFQMKAVDFIISKPTADIEFVLHTKGEVDFYIDFIRLSKF